LPTENSIADIVSSQPESPPPPISKIVSASAGRQLPEFKLLRACCGRAQNVSRALKRTLRWDQVFEQASYHRVLPALYRALEGRPEVPASIQSALGSRYLGHCQRAMRFCAELARILEHFEEQRIPVLAQKGPALAHLLYGDSTMREFGDLDLLVAPSDVPRAVHALNQLGCEKHLQLSPRQEEAYLRSGYEYVFGRGAERNFVELQWNLLPKFYAIDMNIEELFRRSREQEFDGCRARVLDPEDQLIFLCIHAAKHQWARLGMVQDIAALAGFDLDWGRVIGEARRSGTLRIVLISLACAKQVLGSGLPRAITTAPEMSRAQSFVSRIVESLESMRETPPVSVAYFRFMIEVRERRIDQARFVWRLAMTPGVHEWRAIGLPDRLFPMYSLVRACRLVRRLISFTGSSPS
jgi:hypothetical protein